MNTSGNNNTVSSGQGPRTPSDARAGTQAPITNFPTYLPYHMTFNQLPQFSASPFASGPYDLLEDFHTYRTTAAFPVNDTTRHPTAASLTRVPEDSNMPNGVVQSHVSTPPRQISDYVMLYVTLAVKPPSLKKQEGGEMAPFQIIRVRQSAQWYPASVRAALWSSPGTRRKVFDDHAKPTAPMSFEEACKIDLRHISTTVLPELPQEKFWTGMRRMYPWQGDIQCHLSEWAMGCPNCEKEVIGYATDTHWSERYLHHRANLCGK